MAGVTLRDYQEEALSRMKNGCILNGGVGSGKSRTALAYYYVLNSGIINTKEYVKMIFPMNLYIITTARKRDTLEWEKELLIFRMSTDPKVNMYTNNIVVDSWNNIHKYTDVENAFFIFDEQRVVGYGAWTKSFLTITRKNKWILLSATPGDTWMDYVPVFIANGFFKNKTDFIRKHAVYSRFSKYPKIEKYINEGILLRMRKSILINMNFERKTVSHHEWLTMSYNRDEYLKVVKTRWNPYNNQPIKNAGEYCYTLRKLVNSDPDRLDNLLIILSAHPKIIVFYSYDYELFLLRELLKHNKINYAEWNGHKHESIPITDSWVYLVEYTAGSEGWNCIETDTIVFYSLNYSYKVLIQSSGRIDRLNTPYHDLFYYHFTSNSSIDKSIMAALRCKKKFNEKGFAPSFKND